MKAVFRVGSCTVLLLLSLGVAGCMSGPRSARPAQEKMPAKDINAVLDAHDEELMAVPGVTGVYVGVLEDGKTPCLKVMVVRKTPELERALPKALEGHPVVIEETGVIRPMK